MNLSQVFDPAERLLAEETPSQSTLDDPLARQGGLLTYGMETILKGLGYSVQKATRLATILAPLSLSCCGPSPEEVQQRVQDDVRMAMDEVYRLPDPSCDEVEKTLKDVFTTIGYEPAGERDFSNLGATILTSRHENRVAVRAEDLNGSLIIMKMAECKPEDLQR